MAAEAPKEILKDGKSIETGEADGAELPIV
jgi:hypothetical protein